MSKDLNRYKGGVGEGIAARLLRSKGHDIIEMNHRTKFGEIDLISLDGGIIVFTEVKLKVGEDFGSPEEMIGPRKVLQVKRTAEFYLLQNQQLASSFPQYRIDAVCIVTDQSGEVIRADHYENIDN